MENRFQPFGILPAMITPMTKDGKLNEKALRKLINHMIEGGVHGVFAVGTTGEFYSLTADEYGEILGVTLDETGGRVPVYAGASAISTRECVALAEVAERAGVDALTVLTPFFISLSQAELYQHYKTVAEATSLPVLLYNNAPKTNISIAPATVARLADIPNIVGVKDSTGDMTNTAEYIRLTRGRDFSVMMGRDTLIYACLCYGGTGGVAACANVAPRICADIYDKFTAGDRAGALEAQYRLAPLRIAFQLGSFPTVIKEALELIGIEAGPCVPPTGPMKPEEKEELKRILRGMGLLQ
jgi:4-hydroxy-tetrahydrodipicolinate synthase